MSHSAVIARIVETIEILIAHDQPVTVRISRLNNDLQITGRTHIDIPPRAPLHGLSKRIHRVADSMASLGHTIDISLIIPS